MSTLARDTLVVAAATGDDQALTAMVRAYHARTELVRRAILGQEAM